MTWNCEIYKNTRSKSVAKRQEIVITPWMLEPMFVDDMLSYQMGKDDILRIGMSFRNECRSAGVLHRLKSLLRRDAKIEDGYSVMDKETGVMIDAAITVDGCPLVITPWKNKSFIDKPKRQIMHWVQSVLDKKCVWVGMDTVQKGCQIEQTEADLPLDAEMITPPQRCWRIARLILEGSTMCGSARPEMCPNLKSFYPHLPWSISSEKYEKGMKEKEVSLLPYVTTPLRRLCHLHEIYDYDDERFLPLLEEHGTPGMASFTIPWLRFNRDSDEPYRIMNPGELLKFQNRWDETKDALFIDFETLDNRIYLCGVFFSKNGQFHSLWSENRDDEKMLIWNIFHLLSRYPSSSIYYYCAERSMWKTSCQRHGFSLDDPVARLFDQAVDVYRILQSCGVLIRGSPNLKLKSVGKALHRHGFVSVPFPEDTGIRNGGDSVMLAEDLYLNNRVSNTSDVEEIKKNETQYAVWLYNKYDCEILHAIVGWLLSIQPADYSHTVPVRASR